MTIPSPAKPSVFRRIFTWMTHQRVELAVLARYTDPVRQGFAAP